MTPLADDHNLLEYLDLGAEPTSSADALDDVESRIVSDVNQRIAARDSTEAVVDFLFEQTRHVCPGDRISIALVDETRQRLVSHYTKACYEPLILRPGYAEDLRGSSLERVIQTPRLRLIHDLRGYLACHPRSDSSRALVQEGVQSSLTCPLQVEDRVVGVLFRSARVPRAYSQRHARVHAILADRLSQAVEKTYHLEQLVAANLAYSEMLGFVSHELKSPIAAMVSTAELLGDGYLGPVNEQQQEALSRIGAKGRYLLGLVHDYLELARLESGGLRYSPREDVDFERDVLAVALDIVRSAITRRGIGVEQELELDGHVALDDSLMKIVMVNLLDNAVKYGSDRGRIRVTARRRADALEVSVWNEGPGFPPEEHSRLFKKFSRLKTKELRGIRGSGVGLYTVWRIIQLHRGRITARSEYGAWAEFAFTIPQS